MPAQDDIPATRMRSREEVLIGLADDGGEQDELEGYDPSQRAEILEATMDGADDGEMLTVLLPDPEGYRG